MWTLFQLGGCSDNSSIQFPEGVGAVDLAAGIQCHVEGSMTQAVVFGPSSSCGVFTRSAQGCVCFWARFLAAGNQSWFPCPPRDSMNHQYPFNKLLFHLAWLIFIAYK